MYALMLLRADSHNIVVCVRILSITSQTSCISSSVKRPVSPGRSAKASSGSPGIKFESAPISNWVSVTFSSVPGSVSDSRSNRFSISSCRSSWTYVIIAGSCGLSIPLNRVVALNVFSNSSVTRSPCAARISFCFVSRMHTSAFERYVSSATTDGAALAIEDEGSFRSSEADRGAGPSFLIGTLRKEKS